MKGFLKIEAVDPDDDYLGVEISASNDRFSASTYVYTGLNELSELGDILKGFPINYLDVRKFTLGQRMEDNVAGGFCELSFRCSDRSCHITVEIEIEDDSWRYTSASAKFAFSTFATDIDLFAQQLKNVSATQSGIASLGLYSGNT